MTLLITGANGFLGNYVVAEALRQGHAVKAMVRAGADPSTLAWAGNPNVELVRLDLNHPDGLTVALRGVDCVIHLAAAKRGDYQTQYAGTVTATENLLKAMGEAKVLRIVALSSFSVYDFMAASPLVALDEQSPLEKKPEHRDDYAKLKLAQEKLILEVASKAGWEWVVLRPGMIWGKDNLLNAWAGTPAGGRAWIRTGGGARIPLTYVENCAEAVVLAAGSESARGNVFNVVDDALPTQGEYLNLIRARINDRRYVIPVPFGLLRFASGTAWLLSHKLTMGRARVPGVLVPARLNARARPLAYSNQKIKALLGWKPRYSLQQGLDRSTSDCD
jgi:nucleoside-diphosphate-sugar epimerase